MKKIVTIIAGLTISLSLISETRTDSGIVYVKNEMTEQKEFKGIVKVIRKGHDKVYLKREKYFM